MTLELWRFSTTVQVASVMIIAVFFATYARQARTAEGWTWRDAWLADQLALVATVAYWSYLPTDGAFGVVIGAYMACKLAFAVLIAEGAWRLAYPGRAVVWSGWLRAACIGYGLGAAVAVDTLPQVGLLQHSALTVGFVVVAAIALRGERRILGWLAAGAVVRAALAALATVAYAIDGGVVSVAPATLERARWLLATQSGLDAVSEWLLALGMVFAMTARARRDLERVNDDLLATQESLRALVDRDALTGLANRRVLPVALRAAQPTGAVVVYLDLDRFKEINDLHGHAIGDAVLVQFTEALRECFRPEDTIVRHGGDEFVVIAPGLDAPRTEERLRLLQARLAAGPTAVPLGFSAGFAVLAQGGWPDEALAAADAAMYEAKRQRASSR